MDCHAPESMIAHGPTESTTKLTLPWPEEDFEIGMSRLPKVCIDSDQGNGGLYCEIIKAMTLW